MRLTPLFLVLALWPAVVAGDLRLDPRTDPADARRLEELVAKCERELESFRDLMDAIRRSGRDVPVWPGRNQPLVAVDRFGTWEIDLSDLERLANPTRDPASGRWVFPPGADPQGTTLCQALGHVLFERFHSSYLRGTREERFQPSHRAANDFEGAIRREYGQSGSPVDRLGEEDAIGTVYRNGRFIVERIPVRLQPDDSLDIDPPVTVEVDVICYAACGGPEPRLRVQAGAASCADCEAEIRRRCGDRGVQTFVCRLR